jgi:hypothetical protein
MRRAQWQHLPDCHSGCLQEINEAAGVLPKVTLVTFAGQ